MIKVDKKIVGYAVNQPEAEEKDAKREFKREGGGGDRAEVIRMHEKLERPEMLVGSTYKVKTPISDHAMYVTINDIILNEGTEYEKRRPFEIFINSKNLDHYQWIVALTRIISAVFRKGGIRALIEESGAPVTAGVPRRHGIHISVAAWRVVAPSDGKKCRQQRDPTPAVGEVDVDAEGHVRLGD